MTMHALESISARLTALQQQLPKLIAAYPDDAHFWPAFAELADEIKSDAGTMGDETWHWAFEQMQDMLYKQGKISLADLDV